MKKETRENKTIKNRKLNAEILLSALDDLLYSIKKIDREMAAIVRAAAPSGYVCRSVECRGGLLFKTPQCLDIAERFLNLTKKKERIRELMAAIRSAINEIPAKRTAYALFLRYQKGLICKECADIMKLSTRHFYRLLNNGLDIVTENLLRDENGKTALEDGIAVFLHRYGK